jgi:hypothetical protein
VDTGPSEDTKDETATEPTTEPSTEPSTEPETGPNKENQTWCMLSILTNYILKSIVRL